MARGQSLYDWCQEDIENRGYLLEEWNTEQNEQELGLTLYNVTKGSGKNAYWVCRKCNYSWNAAIKDRTHGSGCLKCKYDTQSITRSTVKQYESSLEYLQPNLMKEWDYEKNKKLGLDPSKLYPNSNKYAYWVCRVCNHNWKAKINNRTLLGNGCPKCGISKYSNANSTVKQYESSLEYLYPDLMKEWDYEKNKEIGLEPSKLYSNSRKYAYWVCRVCNYSWKAKIQNRTQGSGCSNCNDKSRTEELVKDILIELNMPYQREWKQQIKQTDRYYDFFLYDNRLVIEVDGLQHFKYFEANDSFGGDIKADNDKNDYLLQVRTPLLRLPGLDMLNWSRRQVGLKAISIYQFKPILKKYIVNFINTRKIPFDIIQDYKIHSNTNYYEVALKMNEMEDKRNANEL